MRDWMIAPHVCPWHCSGLAIAAWLIVPKPFNQLSRVGVEAGKAYQNIVGGSRSQKMTGAYIWLASRGGGAF